MDIHPLNHRCNECGGGLKVSEAHKTYKGDIDLLITRLGKPVLVCDCDDGVCTVKTVFVEDPDINAPLQYTMSLTVFVNEWLLREEALAMDWVSALWDSEIWMRKAESAFFSNSAIPGPTTPTYGDIFPYS
jgi:hypothetical protein